MGRWILGLLQSLDTLCSFCHVSTWDAPKHPLKNVETIPSHIITGYIAHHLSILAVKTTIFGGETVKPPNFCGKLAESHTWWLIPRIVSGL